MRYEGRLYRPPSEAYSYILQATIGCSHNLCVYCDMYRDKKFRVRPLTETLEDIALAKRGLVQPVEKVFVADGDALFMETDHWLAILDALRESFPRLRQVSCYAMARNVLAKSDDELRKLCEAGLNLLYVGPETGDPQTLKRLVKGGTREEHIEAAKRAHEAGMRLSVIALLGAAGTTRSEEHAKATASLVTEMDPEFFAALTLTVVPGTPMARMQDKGLFELPDIYGLLRELRTMIAHAEPTDTVFRTNHASNYLPIAGRLPQDRDALVELIDRALAGEIPLRPPHLRGL